MRSSVIWTACIGLALAACQSATPPTHSAAVAPRQTVSVPPAPSSAAAAQPVHRKAPIAPIDPEKIKKRLLGLHDFDVTALFGQPAFARRDKPAEVWQYRDGTCILDLFLYEAGSSQVVQHVDIRSTSDSDLKAGYCFADKFGASDPARRG